MNSNTNQRFNLFIASFLLLFFELACIRWLPGQVRVLAYFTNFVLMGCFFGMGLGMLCADSTRDFLRFLCPSVTLLVLLASVCGPLWIYGASSDLFMFLEYEGHARFSVPIVIILALFYCALTLAFLPWGQFVGRSFSASGNRLIDYSLNLFGSIAGIISFSLCSWFRLPAWVWFTLIFLAILIVTKQSQRARIINLVLAVVTGFVVFRMDRGITWSPYHKIEIEQGLQGPGESGFLFPFMNEMTAQESNTKEPGFHLRVNDDFYQHAFDLSDAAVVRTPNLQKWRDHYDLPYKGIDKPERVLIVGGGTGNDAAAAIRNGAGHVDVVEIDPVIAELGEKYHPEAPYSDERVKVYIDDARHFLRHAKGPYDIVVFGLLDSHRLLGTLSSLRLDSYVYTVESFQAARSLLSDKGVQFTSFGVGEPWVEERFHRMLKEVYGEDPYFIHSKGGNAMSLVYLSGPGVAKRGFKAEHRETDASVDLLTDDWPFTYAKGKFIPEEYILSLVLIFALSAIFMLKSARLPGGIPNWHFFFLGSGFLLLETRNLTALALLFGSTWIVNSFVFISVLFMNIISTFIMSILRDVPYWFSYSGLAISLAINYLVPLSVYDIGASSWNLVFVGIVFGLPFLFSSLIFVRSFKGSSSGSAALGSNIIGAVMGGLLEYCSMITGLRFLLILAASLYGLSLVGIVRQRQSTFVR